MLVPLIAAAALVGQMTAEPPDLEAWLGSQYYGSDVNVERATERLQTYSSRRGPLRSRFPEIRGCSKTLECLNDLFVAFGMTASPPPAFDDYFSALLNYTSGEPLKRFCGIFDAISLCFARDPGTCQTQTVYSAILQISESEAYQYVADMQLRTQLCEYQTQMQDPCLAGVGVFEWPTLEEDDDESNCNISAYVSENLQNAVANCPVEVQEAFCKITQSLMSIKTLGYCDGRIPQCPTVKHSCTKMKKCFDAFYDGLADLGVVAMPNYPAYVQQMEYWSGPKGIDTLCRLEAQLDACALLNINRHCIPSAESFQTMYGLNYEQAYDYYTDHRLRINQCENQAYIHETRCVGRISQAADETCNATLSNLSHGVYCIDLAIMMECKNGVVGIHCNPDALHTYCETQTRILQQEALGFCDGWMPRCPPPAVTEVPETSAVTNPASDPTTTPCIAPTYPPSSTQPPVTGATSPNEPSSTAAPITEPSATETTAANEQSSSSTRNIPTRPPTTRATVTTKKPPTVPPTSTVPTTTTKAPESTTKATGSVLTLLSAFLWLMRI